MKLLQLPLAVQLPDNETFESFYTGGNAPLVAALRDALKQRAGGCFYMWGKSGCGKSHLLHAVLADAKLPALYLPLRSHDQLSTAVLEGSGHFPLVCLDDLEAIAGQPDWELAIFNLFNQIRESQGILLLTASASARHLPLGLPDLASRLDWGTSFQVQELDDDQKLTALTRRAHARGIELSEDAGRYLINRVSRDMSTLWQSLNTLDRASIAAQRKLTIPFIKQTLDL